MENPCIVDDFIGLFWRLSFVTLNSFVFLFGQEKMVVSIGTDIVEIERVKKVLLRFGGRFVQRILTQGEISEWHRRGCAEGFLARRFAAKEAISKALKTGISESINFQDISIKNDQKGAPFVVLSDKAGSLLESFGATRVLLSISDERSYAIAYAMIVS